MKKNILDWALFYLEKGFSVIPIAYRDKRPLVKWKEYQSRRPSREEVEKWFKGKQKINIGIVCGRVSGNLVVLDFDNKEVFKRFLSRLPPGLKDVFKFTWIIETGRGYQVPFRLKDEEAVPRTKPKLIEGVDIKAEGGYVVVPPSIHPNGKQYKFIEGTEIFEPYILSKKDFEKILELLTTSTEREETISRETGRQLTEKEILEIVNLLKPFYNRGYRDLIVLYLSGWLRKAEIGYSSAKKVIELLAKEKEDEELNQRIYVLDRTYNLRGSPPDPKEMKGKSGLQEIIEKQTREEEALEVVRRLEEILGVASPYRDSVFELLDYEKQLYAVANLRRLTVVRARRDDNRILYKERVLIGAPTKLTVYINPLGGITKYEVVWETATRPRPLTIGPAAVEDIVDRLKAEGLVLHHRLVKDVVNAIIEGYIRKGKAEVKEEIESPGFYLVNGRIVAVRWELENVSKEELKEALGLLNTLHQYYSHIEDIFATVIKWGIIAPFSYILKQKGKWLPWLYLFGASYTGKTTLGEIVLSLWGLDSKHRKSGANIDTPARIGYVLSQGTFPVLVNEPGAAIYKEEVVELMKAAVESTVARGKYVRGTYTEIPALAPLILTSNKVLPRDDALIRRLLIIRFSYGNRVDKVRTEEEIRRFESTVKPQFHKLKAIGYFVASLVVKDPSILSNGDWVFWAEKLLELAYKAAGLEVPDWLKLNYNAEEDVYEDIKETIRSYLVKRINEEYTRFVGRVEVITEKGEIDTKSRTEIDFEDRVKIVLEERLLPWAVLNRKDVILTTEFAREVQSIAGSIGGLKSLAELLGWEYCNKKIDKKVVKKVIKVKLNEFIEFLLAETE